MLAPPVLLLRARVKMLQQERKNIEGECALIQAYGLPQG